MKPLGYGLIGCGNFGRFCLEQYSSMPELRCVAVADTDHTLAAGTAQANGVDACGSPESLLLRDDVDIVHLATPPGTHARLATAAILAGKHVLCEKPLALSREDALSMAALAEDHGRILAVNLIMRYNPLCAAVKRLAESNLLGRPLFATFINTAQDETLGPEHWFWDRAQSGGIFVEHGVHFFDLFEWWFGPGRMLSAHQLERPGGNQTDQVQCTVRYGDAMLGNFYHGFHQMRRRDEQHWRIVFETGTVVMREWVPTSLEIDFHSDDATASALRELFPAAVLNIHHRYSGTDRETMSRNKGRTVDLHGTLAADAGHPKMELYGVMLRDLMRDQIRAINDKGHHRRVTEANGVSSLLIALDAQRMADEADQRPVNRPAT